MAAHQGNDTAQASKAFALAIPVLKEERALYEQVVCEGNLGSLLVMAGQREEGLRLMMAAVKASAGLRDDLLHGQALASLGLTHFHDGRRSDALPFLQQSVAVLRRAGASHVLGLVLQALDSLRAVQLVDDLPAEEPRVVN